jgi:hypothetical protein
MDPSAAIELITRYGSAAALVFVVVGFLGGYIVTRNAHTEVVDLWRQRLSDSEDRCTQISRENTELRQALVLSNSQATRLASVTERVVQERV